MSNLLIKIYHSSGSPTHGGVSRVYIYIPVMRRPGLRDRDISRFSQYYPIMQSDDLLYRALTRATLDLHLRQKGLLLEVN